jgi:cysteine desulfuration protein SufE
MTDIGSIVEAFELLGDWEERYQYLVEMGEQLPSAAPSLRTEGNKVQGCVSEVWVRLVAAATDGRVHLEGDSNTAIIKGVVALIVTLCRDKTPREVLDIDFDRLFERLELSEHLSPNRHVGVYAIVNKVYAQARALLSEAA